MTHDNIGCAADAIEERMLGGDEFAVVAAGDDLTIQVGASFGFAVFPDDASDRELLMRHADAHLYAENEQMSHLR